MKIYFSRSQPEEEGAVWISDFRSIDVLVNDAEATSIIVDNFLSCVAFSDIGAAIDKIVSKLRMDGCISFFQQDIDMLSHHHGRMSLDFQEYNDLLFSEGPIQSVFNMESLCDLLSSYPLLIETIEMNYDNFQAIVTARRIK